MPERRTSSVTSFVSNLHFSGKLIMASILFGFGLLLVGAILLIIGTGEQKKPPLQETDEAKKTPMIYVGPGVMGVGAFFVIVGTIMCLFETRILRRRKNTDHESLVRSEVFATGNGNRPRTENQEDAKNVEETQVKTAMAECHNPPPPEDPVKSSEKTPPDTSEKEKDYEKELSASTHSFNASVYVEAVGEQESDANDNEEHFTSGSIQFSTPPEDKEVNLLNISLGDKPDKGHDLATEPAGTPVTEKAGKEDSLLLQQENENKNVSETNGSSLLVPTDNEIPQSVSNDSISAAVSANARASDSVLTKASLPPIHSPD